MVLGLGRGVLAAAAAACRPPAARRPRAEAAQREHRRMHALHAACTAGGAPHRCKARGRAPAPLRLHTRAPLWPPASGIAGRRAARGAQASGYEALRLGAGKTCYMTTDRPNSRVTAGPWGNTKKMSLSTGIIAGTLVASSRPPPGTCTAAIASRRDGRQAALVKTSGSPAWHPARPRLAQGCHYSHATTRDANSLAPAVAATRQLRSTPLDAQKPAALGAAKPRAAAPHHACGRAAPTAARRVQIFAALAISHR